MKEKLEEHRNDFLHELRSAIEKKQEVIMIINNPVRNEYFTLIKGSDAEFDDVLKSCCELPFRGRIIPQDAFKDWSEYFGDLALAKIYGFEYKDGIIQIAILDRYITPIEDLEIHEAYCNEKLSNRLFNDGYHGDNIKGKYISMDCAMRWLREVRGVYINIRVTYWEHDYTSDPKKHFIAEICDRKTGRWHDNDIWEKTYEECVEAAINYYYDEIVRRIEL